MESVKILERLIAFATVSRDSNLPLITFVSDLLRPHGISSQLIYSEDGHKANLLASIGPADRAGIVLSGHTDVVPVDGQDWTVPPFAMTERDGKLYGRGAADMKGFIACSLAAMIKASKTSIGTPLHLALSYDEEVGCLGVRSLIDVMRTELTLPLLCIVGEPTGMTVSTGHKGKVAVKVVCKGREGHSAFAPLAVNAIHLGCDFVSALRSEQERLEREGGRDSDYDIPYTTVHAGVMTAGAALNIVPNRCQIDFEIRNVAADSADKILMSLQSRALRIVSEVRHLAPESQIDIQVFNTYPGLDTPKSSRAVAFVKSLARTDTTAKVAFGTEGGLFSESLNVPTVVCGPGFMAQGHKPDEYVSCDQIRRCDDMLSRLLEELKNEIAFN